MFTSIYYIAIMCQPVSYYADDEAAKGFIQLDLLIPIKARK